VTEDQLYELIANDPTYQPLKGKLGPRRKLAAWRLSHVTQLAAREAERSKPGAYLRRVLAWVPASARKEIFGQTIADMREDCQEALATGGKWRYRWVWLCGVFSVFIAFVRWAVPALLGALKLAKTVQELLKSIR
jgi:hypothetical protein